MSNGSAINEVKLLDVAQNAAFDALQTVYNIQGLLYPPKPRTSLGVEKIEPSEVQSRMERLISTLNSIREELHEVQSFANSL